VRDRVKDLSTGVAIYGAGDAAINVVNFLLLPIYVRVLSTADYGALLILISIETLLKVINRWGVDGAFMRYFLDRDDGAPRQRLASTIAVFLLAVDGAILLVMLAASGALARVWSLDAGYLVALRLMLVNAFLMAFTFIPFHVMRMQREAAAYSGLTFARSLATLLLRLLLVLQFGMGVTGIFLTDLIVTIAIWTVLWRWCRGLLRPVFSASDLRHSLRFGLPRLPSGLAQQAFDAGNKLLFTNYVSLSAAGVYQNASTLGSGVKFFLSAFETAWAPFYYATAKQPDAREVFRKMTTYGIAVLVLLVAGTTAIARDVVLIMLTPDYLGAIPVVPIIALGFAFQGVYLLTSIGLNLTSRTEFYPMTTIAAAIVGLSSGLVLMPRYGAIGAATAFLLSFATQAALGWWFARRVYPVPYEGQRVLRLILAGGVATLAAVRFIPELPPVASLLVRGAAVVAIYAGLLWATGFFRPTELRFLREMTLRLRRRGARAVPTNAE